uniref:Uncharacterized protein n=1 Tax=Pseudomonas phage HRDY3 TaxID=3236930 RepID=A0AB39CE69_9VIRU
MKPINIYKPPARTVVTEMRQFLVDNTRRQNINAFSVATKVTEATLEQKDVTIGPDNPYTLKDVHNVLSIQCPHPIKIKLTSFGVIPEPEVRTEQVYFDAEIAIGVANASRFVPVTVVDKDIFTLAPISINVQNMRTGETETVQLERNGQGVYSGFLVTQNNDAQGTDFDGMMFCRKDDILRFIYEEPYGASGLSQTVTKDQVVTLDFEPTEVVAPATVAFGSFLNFRVKNAVGQTATVTNMRSGSTKQVVLGNFAPFEITYDDGPNSFAAEDLDVFQIVTQGKDIYGQIQNVVAEITVGNSVPSIDAQTQVDVTQGFDIVVVDNNMPMAPVLRLKNDFTGVEFNYPLGQKDFAYSGRFVAHFDSFFHVGLPGQPVTISYQGNGSTVTKVLELVAPAPAAPEPQPEPDPEDSVQSAPVSMVVNGHFFLNGSFAGTIELSADTVVRCTLIKA